MPVIDRQFIFIDNDDNVFFSVASNKHLNTFFPSPFSKYATETNEKKTENILTFDDDDDDEEEE